MKLKNQHLPNRSIRVMLSFINSLLNRLADTFVALFITPLIITTLGTEIFGAWKVITNATEILTLGNFKPLGLLRLILAKEIGNDNVVYKQQQIGSATCILFFTLPILIISSYLLFYYKDTVIPVSQENSHQVSVALLVAMFMAVITPFLQLPDTIVKGLNLDYMRIGVNSIAKVVTACLVYYVVVYQATLSWVIIASSLPIFITAIISYVIVLRHVPWFKIVRPPKEMVRSFFKMNVWALLANFFRYVFSSTDLILIGFYYGVTVTAVYSLSRALVSFLLMPANSLMQAGLAGVGDLIGRKELNKVMQLRSEQINALIFSSFMIGVIVMLFNASFITIWVDEKHFGGETLSRWIIVAFIIDAIAQTEAIYIDASLKLKAQATSLGSSAILYLGIIFLLQPILGLNVFPIAASVSKIVLIILYWIGLRDCLQIKLGNIARIVIRPFFIATLLFYACTFIQPFQLNTWLDLIIYAAIVGIIILIPAWMLILQKNDRKRLINRLLVLVGK